MENVAAAAVPAHVFASGQPVARQVVRLKPEQLARAQVIPHPTVNPTQRAALPGKPVSRPPVRPAPVVAARNAAADPGVRPRPGEIPAPPPLATRHPAPMETVERPPAPSTRRPG